MGMEGKVSQIDDKKSFIFLMKFLEGLFLQQVDVNIVHLMFARSFID